jgi:hypothetical protein
MMRMARSSRQPLQVSPGYRARTCGHRPVPLCSLLFSHSSPGKDEPHVADIDRHYSGSVLAGKGQIGMFTEVCKLHNDQTGFQRTVVDQGYFLNAEISSDYECAAIISPIASAPLPPPFRSLFVACMITLRYVVNAGVPLSVTSSIR